MTTEAWSALAPYLARRLEGTDLAVRSVWQNTEGWSMETFSLAVEYTRGGARVSQDIILRREPVAGLLEPYDVSVEYRVLRALEGAGIAIPRAWFHEPDPSVFERPFYAMEKVDGSVHFMKQAAGPDYRLIKDDAERASLASDFLDNLARIHRVDWRAAGLGFLGDPGPGPGSALSQVGHWERVLARSGALEHPLVAFAARWLRRNAPDNDTPRLVHGDYRTGNFLHRQGRIRAVLDWEMVHVGDPHEDLAYALINLWRSPPPTNWVCHLLPEEEFLSRYQEASGIRVEPRKLAWYDVLNDFKSCGIISTAAHAFAQGRTTDMKPGVFGTLIDFALVTLAQHLDTAQQAATRGSAAPTTGTVPAQEGAR